MKRFLALFAVMAIVMSMFSGVVLADYEYTSGDVYVALDKDVVTFGEGFNAVYVTGKIFHSDSDALAKDVDAEVKVYKDTNGNGEYDDSTTSDPDDLILADYTTTADNGVFEFKILTDSDETGIGTYFVVGVDDAPPAPADPEYQFDADGDAYDTFTIMYDMELANPEKLEWAYGEKGQIVVQGIFVNGDNTYDEAQVVLAYQDDVEFVETGADTGLFDVVDADSDPDTFDGIAEANFVDEDAFGFLFDASNFTTTGDIGLYVNGVLAIEGEITTDELDVTLTPDELVRSLGETEFTAKFDLSDKQEAKIASGNYQIWLTVKDSNDLALRTDDNITTAKTGTTGYVADKDHIKMDMQALTANPLGDYEVTFELMDVTAGSGNEFVVAENTLTVEVVKAAKYNLYKWNDDSVSVGEVDFSFDDESEDRVVAVVDVAGKTYKNIEAIFDGAGLDEETFDNFNDTPPVTDFTVKPTETGTLTVTINVYEDVEGAEVPKDIVKSFTEELEVTGWNVDITPSEVVVGYEGDITFVITDEDGNPVNNAVIYYGETQTADDILVDGTTNNIVGGVYVYEEDEKEVFKSVGDVVIQLWKADGSEAEVKLTSGIEVLGEQVYSVTSDMPVLLNGIKDEVCITALDENGDVIYPTFVMIQYDSDGDKIDTNGTDPGGVTVELSGGKRKDLDDDGVKEAVKFEITPDASAVTLVVRASTDAKAKVGEVEMEVQKPQVVHTKATKLTENFETEFEFTVVDPRDDSVMDVEVEMKDENLNYGAFADLDDKALSQDSDSVWTGAYLVHSVNWDDAEDDEKTVRAKLTMDDVTLATIEVVEPTLVADPENVIINAPTNITLTYTDANGNALEDYTVKLDGESLGKTDENGQVVYAASSTSSLSLEFTAATDATAEVCEIENDIVTTLKVKSTADTVAPVATVEVSGNSAVIKVADNVRVNKVLVDGVPVDIFFPMPEVTHIAPLADSYKVQAIDINNNYSETVLTVEIESVTFTIGEETEYGAPMLVEDTTMVPVRFAEQLGAAVAWNPETETVTYTLGETVISMTLGSTTAVVNGENVQLTAAPFLNDAGRTMVPLRMIAKELGFTVMWTSNDAPVSIVK